MQYFFRARVYPNPADRYFDIRMNAVAAGACRLSLVAADGKVVWNTGLYLRAGETRRLMRPAGLAGGVYMLLINNTANGWRWGYRLLFR